MFAFLIPRKIRAQLDRIELALNNLTRSITVTATDIASAIAELQASVQQETSVDQSAIALINGIPALIAAAVSAAQAAGATPAQLASFDQLAATIQGNATSLAAAVTANTPAAPAPTPPATPTP